MWQNSPVRRVARQVRRLTVSAVAVLAAVTLSLPAYAQCPGRWEAEGILPGTDYSPYTSVRSTRAWDPDGPGPEPARLVLVGGFSLIGNIVANNIAAWDGPGTTSWRTFGPGIQSGASGAALGEVKAVYHNELIVGGSFTTLGTPGTSYLGRWDGQAWRALGNGVNGAVSDATVFNGDLVVTGSFTMAGGAPAARIARWDGAAWQPLGAGLDAVAKVWVYNGDLIAAGPFTSAGGVPASGIARWDGAAWHALGAGVSGGAVTSWTLHGPDLVVTGNFTTAGGAPAIRIARWDGEAWHPFGSGPPSTLPIATATNPQVFVFDGEVHVNLVYDSGLFGYRYRVFKWSGETWVPLGTAMEGFRSVIVHNGQLFGAADRYSGGCLAGQPALPIPYVVRWTGTTWESISAAADGLIHGLTTFAGELIAYGFFDGLGAVPTINVARWDGSRWRTLGRGIESSVTAMLERPDGVLMVGGWPGAAGDGGTAVECPILKWSDSQWEQVAAPLSAPWCYPMITVAALAEYNGDLVAGGSFYRAGSASIFGIARWDGEAWRPFGTGISGGDSGVSGNNPAISAMVQVGGDLIVGGKLSSAGGIQVHNIARWDGAAWHAMGPGLANLGTSVLSLAADGGAVIAGCSTGQIARWDGSAWQTIGTANGPVRALRVHEDQLLAAGGFTTIDGASTGTVASWDGEAWQPLGQSPPVAGYALTHFNGDIVVGGSAIYPDSGGALARWNAQQGWRTMDGTSSTITTLAVHNGELLVGGQFMTVGRPQFGSPYSRFVSPYIARWIDPVPAPTIAVPPASIPFACRGGQAAFTVTPGAPDPALTYAWRRDGQSLVDGPTSSGSVISGATTATLTITNLAAADSGAYTVSVSSACGAANSIPATLTVSPYVTDADCNGVVDPSDVAMFIAAWYRGITGGTLEGDFDHNGAVNPSDVVIFVSTWFSEVGR